MTDMLDVMVRSSLVLLVGMATMPALRRHSAALRHWVLFATLLCAAAAPAVNRILPAWEVVDAGAVLPEPLADRVAAVSRMMTPSTSPAHADKAPREVAERESWAALLVPIWAAGAALSFGMLLVGVARLYRVHALARPLTAGAWQTPAAAVRVSAQPGLLLVWGFRNPTIIVPASAVQWPRERVSTVLQHELAHVARHDWLLLIVAETVRALYWFHPLVWLTCARMRSEAELACDDAVIASGTPGPAYASHVVAIARELTARSWLPAPAIARQSTLERRVRAMLEKNRNRTPPSTRARASALGIVLATTLAVAAIAAQSFVSLTGTIVDPTDAVLPNVTLQLTNEDTQAKYEIKTDRNGRYEFVGLPPGTYRLESRLPGFSAFTGQVVVSASNLQQDVQMAIGMLQETITVTSAPPGAPEPPARPGLSDEQRQKLEELRRKRAQQAVGGAANCPPDPPPGTPRIGGNIRVPLKFKDKRPVYPAALRGTEGRVVLQATIGRDGTIGAIKVVESTHQEFTDSAVAAVREWEFDATLLNCQSIETPMTVTAHYQVR